MRFLLTLFFFVFQTLSFAQPIADYFPSDQAIRYIYEGKYKDNKTGKLKSHLDTFYLKNYKLDNVVWNYYWEDFVQFGFVGYNLFFTGAYSIQNDSVFIACLTDEKQIPEISNTNTFFLFPPNLTNGYSVKIIYDEKNYKIFKFTGNETIIVKGKKYTNCIRIDYEDIWKTSAIKPDINGTVWLYPNIGVIKWKLPAGTVNELASFEILPETNKENKNDFYYKNKDGKIRPESDMLEDEKNMSEYTRAVYNDKGYLIEEHYWGTTGEMSVSSIYYKYNEKDQLISETMIYDKNHEWVSEFEYDSNDRLISYKSKMDKNDDDYYLKKFLKYDDVNNKYGIFSIPINDFECKRDLIPTIEIVSVFLFSKIHPIKK